MTEVAAGIDFRALFAPRRIAVVDSASPGKHASTVVRNLMLVLSIRELTASLFLYTTATRTLAIVIYEKYITGSWAAVASISLIFTASLALITLAGRRWLQARI